MLFDIPQVDEDEAIAVMYRFSLVSLNGIEPLLSSDV